MSQLINLPDAGFGALESGAIETWVYMSV